MKAELKDVLHLYRGCDIVCEEIRYTLKAVMIDGEDHDENQEIWVIAENKHREYTFNLEDSKPILRQLLDLKRDEIIQFFKLKGIECHRGVFRTGIGRIKWNKGVADGMSFKKYELAYCSIINEEIELPLLWAGICQAKSLSEPMTQQGNKKLNEKRIHPCHKPILLYQKLIADYGWTGMKILDTHVGGGSSRIAAHRANCQYTGFEIDTEYYEKQEKRFNTELSQLRIF